MDNNKQIITIEEAWKCLGVFGIKGLYKYIYDNYTPEEFVNWVFIEICNSDNITHYKRRFNEYYLYKIKMMFKIPNELFKDNKDRFFVLDSHDVEYIIKTYYKINFYGLNQMWNNFYVKNKLYNKTTVKGCDVKAMERMRQMLQEEYKKIQGTSNKTRMFIKDITDELYKNHKNKYGKTFLVKTQLQKIGFRINNEKYGNAYINISEKIIKENNIGI